MSDVSHVPEASAAGDAAWVKLGRSILTAERFAFGAAIGLWLGDAGLLAATRAGASWAQWALGIGAAAFVAFSTALVLGALLGPALVPVAEGLVARARDGWVALRRGEVGTRHAFLARVLALPVVVAVWAAATYRLLITILLTLARPEAVAAVMTASDMALAVLLVALWPYAVHGARVLVDRASRVRRLRWLVARTWPLPTLVAVVALATSIAAIVVEWPLLSLLPWHYAIPVTCLLLGVVLVTDLPRAPAWLRRGLLGLATVALACACIAAVRMRRESSAAQKIGYERALSGRLGYTAWRLVTDFDGDGQISALGGGDCAPFDPRRYTGAPDVPGNGIDEDCDGVDGLPPEAVKHRPALPLPVGVIPARPTVVFVTIDALAAPELSALGSPRPVMPHLDDLASRSMLFAHCFSEGPSTRLSFPSIFTSRWDSQQTFEYSTHLPYSFSAGERTLQAAFDDAGYETAAVVPNAYFEPTRWASLTRGFQRVDRSALPARSGKDNAAEVTDAALRILSERRDRPLYLWVHYYDAHLPYAAPHGVPAERRDDRVYYEAELKRIDHELGRLFDAVDHLPGFTYLVLTGDHATSFHPVPESRRSHYGFDIYTSTLHVPLLFHGPGLQIGRDDDVVSTMDVASTLANLLHLDDRGRFEGTSLVPEILTGARDATRAIFHEYYLPENGFHDEGDSLELVSVRTDQYDLILNRERGTYELYDWTVDYYEQHDLLEERSRSPDVTHLRSLLGAFIQKIGTAK